ncbi:MAG: ferrous iron transport protein B [Deltaproteobacteria bacterium]|nr:ferrous iron transport protein B [Deltaproteobacteria bacterium]
MSPAARVAATPAPRLVAALVGNPNAGKTTIFNALTGLRQKVGNYPGVTVDRRAGEMRLPGGDVAEIIDLPGTYSLVTVSLDEQVVSEVLRGTRRDARPQAGDDVTRPQAIIAVVDASNLARNLFLVSQLLDLRLPTVIALNMVDVAEEHGRPVDAAALAEAMGCAVIPVVGNRREGIDQLGAALVRATPSPPIAFPIAREMLDEESRLAAILGDDGPSARRLLAVEPGADLDALRARFEGDIEAARDRLQAQGIDPAQEDIEARYRWIDGVVAKAVHEPEHRRRTTTDRVDAVLMHRFFGLVVFALIMTALFTCVFWLAKPMMDAVKDGVAMLGTKVGASMAEGPLRALVVDGIFAGVGAVLVFVPQIALLFLFLAALEDSGYLARAAFLMDRVLSKIGLNGKSFIPLLSSFACAIPGILATRTIEGRRDRLATILVAPFMTCSARLPVYALLVGALIPNATAWQQALVLFALYAAGILAAVITSLLLSRRLDRAHRSSFILELPTYKRPQVSQVLWQVWTNTRAFVTRAGTTILALSIVLWALLYYPRLPAEQLARHPTAEAQQAAQTEHSFAGRAGHALEPAVRPLGYDWKMGVGLVSAFAAREVFVSTLGITYSVGNTSEDTKDLAQAMASDRRPDGSRVWTPLVAVSLMLWFVLAMQCISTMAVVRRETGSWKWPLAQLAFMNGVAYVVCLIVYQIGRRFFGG